MTGPEAFTWLGSEYTSNCEVKGLENIPEDGKCLIVSNHPMGAADAIALYYQICKVRQDSFFFANELFVYLLGAFDEVIAPVVWNKEKETHSASKITLGRIKVFFDAERPGIIFPSGRLSKLTLFGSACRNFGGFAAELDEASISRSTDPYLQFDGFGVFDASSNHRERS